MLPATIVTDRFKLRPFTLEDLDDVWSYAQDPEWARYLPIPQPNSSESTRDFIARQLELDPEVSACWAVEHEATVIGGLNIGIDSKHRRAVLGYSIARPFWGQGMMTEAAGAVIDSVFESCPNLVKICASADPLNRASTRVMEKVGMVKEGLFRNHIVHRGEVVDQVWHAILRTEWEVRLLAACPP